MLCSELVWRPLPGVLLTFGGAGSDPTKLDGGRAGARAAGQSMASLCALAGAGWLVCRKPPKINSKTKGAPAICD